MFVNLSTEASRPAPTPFHADILPSRPAIHFYDTEGHPIAAESVVDITGDLEITEDGALTVQTALHAKAKEAPGFRFYSLSDRRMRQWLCRKHKVRTGKDVRCRLSLQSVSFWFESRA